MGESLATRIRGRSPEKEFMSFRLQHLLVAFHRRDAICDFR